jgi:hypothetical protein
MLLRRLTGRIRVIVMILNRETLGLLMRGMREILRIRGRRRGLLDRGGLLMIRMVEDQLGLGLGLMAIVMIQEWLGFALFGRDLGFLRLARLGM